ncbi:hypothetical protein TYRP_010839 [Tyrophagus putrescentiae]|nr:hypothetical protein TYRP_010839 [Tyrophagus putrescentiae]
MNLYEVLSRKIYLSSNQQRRRAHTISSAEEEPHNEDQPPKRKRVQRDSTLSRNPSIPKFQRPSYISRNRKLEDDEYDLLDASNSYRRYRLLSAANSEHARTECRAYFETIVSQVDRIKLAVVCFACFHVVGTILEVAFSFFIDLLTTLHLSETSPHLNQRRLILSITFGLLCPSIALGIFVATRWHPQRHLFSLSHKNSLFIISAAFALVALDELATLACHYFHQLIPLPLTISFKCALVGFVYIYLLYIMFDVKISAISRQEAQTWMRAFLVMTSLGVVTGLTFHLHYFFPKESSLSEFRSSVMFSVLLCRFFVSINCAIVFYLIWNGVGSLSKHTTITPEDFDDFLAYYDMNRQCTDQLLTLNCVCLACQAKTHHNVDQLNEDNFSIRTVKVWRKSCFAVAGSIIFSAAFTAEVCHLCFTSIWPDRYYPKNMSPRQIFYAHTVLMGSLLFSRIWLLFKPIIIGYKTTIQENKELLGHYAWHRNCHRFALVYLGHIAANLMQLYLFEYSVFMVFLTNLLFGVSLGFMMEIVFKFISNFMTITASTIQTALMAAMFQLSVTVFAIYYMLDYVQLTTPLFYINLVGSVLALVLKTIVSRCQCLVSKNSFDLVEMQPYINRSSSTTPATELLPKSNTLPPMQTLAPETPRALHPARVSWNDLPSQALPSPPSTHSMSLLSPSTPTAHQHPSCSSARSSHTQLYWYQVANSDAHRKSSAAAVIAYRIKYRLESIVSILK